MELKHPPSFERVDKESDYKLVILSQIYLCVTHTVEFYCSVFCRARELFDSINQ
jgi:hypothetical protein